jgi:hypothetical protein
LPDNNFPYGAMVRENKPFVRLAHFTPFDENAMR